MLSRLDDPRVFLSSDDVVLGSSAARRSPRRGLGPPAMDNQRALDADSDSDFSPEDETLAQLHPQHPYNLRRSRTAAAKALALRSSRSGRRRLTESAESQPMEFVMLPSGDIRPRDECPPGMALPPPAPAPRVGRRLEMAEMSDESPRSHGRELEADGESEAEGREGARGDPTGGRRHIDGRGVEREREHRSGTEQRPKNHAGRRRMEKTPQRAERDGRNGYASSSGDGSASGLASAASLSSSGRAETPTRSGQARAARRRRVAASEREDSDEDEDEGGELALRTRARSASDARKERARQALMISRQRTPKTSARQRLEQGRSTNGSTAQPKKMDVAPVYHIDDGEDDGVSGEEELEREERVEKPSERPQRTRTPRADRKLHVKQLLSSKDEATPSKRTSPSKVARQLEQELQSEKKRVLEKMTLLLEEQSKNQRLHRQIEALESQLDAKKAPSPSESSPHWEERVHALEKKHSEAVRSMEEQLEQRDAAVQRLEQDKAKLKEAVAKLRDRAGRDKKGTYASTEIQSELKSQMDTLAASIRKFLKRVDRWKANSKEAMACCDRKTDLATLMESMWLDFPQFPDWTSTSDNHAVENGATQGHDNIARFLKKRVRTREDELRQLQAKYVELKELCARQCVREADLQNFINEHRLRGNLVIRKGGNGDGESAKKRTTPRQQREAEGPPSRRAAKPEAFYADDGEDDDEDEDDERHDNNNNEYESDGQVEQDEDDEGEYPLREPKIFVQVGRDGLYEHTPVGTSAVMEKLADQQRRHGRKKSAAQGEVERIRLMPSPSLSQRYERVATPTNNGLAQARKKKPQAPLQPPPRSGAASKRSNVIKPGVSSSSLPRPRQPSTSVRSKPVPASRPTATASAKGASSLGRPWM